MFNECTSLISAPKLPATTLVNSCYSNMFKGCSKLKYIECYADTLSDTYSQNWVVGVASAGTFVKAVGATLPVGNNGVPTNWVLINGTELFSFQAGNTSSSIALTTPTGLSITLETSSDGVNWSNWTKTNGVFSTITLQSGETLYIRGNNTRFATDTASTRSSRFLFTGNTYCRGNIMYLLDKTGQLDSLNGKGYCFGYLFSGATSLITPPELPATALAGNCYYSMFRGCTSLVTAPELPATALAGSCYGYMFNGCTSLVAAPELPATALAGSCYGYMFNGCTSLKTPPELPATTLTSFCYDSMFRGCSKLTTAPELPATTLASYCYSHMFYGCSNLNYIKVGALSWNTSYTTSWVDGVSANGDFYKPSSTTIDYGVNGVPSGWTIHSI